MSREEYMKQLAYLLQDIPDNERKEALVWYEDYFDEAGPEQEAEVIRELGSPEKVAAVIKDGLKEGNDKAGEYTETGYQDARFREDNKVPQPRTASWQDDKEGSYQYDASGTREKKKRGRGDILLIILLCILAIPVALPVLASIFGVLAGIFGVVVAIAVSAAVLTVVALILGVVFVGIGIAKIIVAPGVGFLMMGGGLLALAAGIVLLLASIVIYGKAVPWLIRKITEIVSRMIKKRRGGL
ncbi:MAG: DUF1700 domain-containing protein [Hominisplanchenecus sp.]|nr:DUF1700 domain-containing protein [Lachnospiraceae bacterium]